MKKIILASNSPRRKEILNKFGIEFKILPSNCTEKYSLQYDEKIVRENSSLKASAVITDEDCLIIAADTVVILNSVCLVKPQNVFEAFFTLKNLSNKTHYVVTSHTILDNLSHKEITEISTSEVTFKKLSNFEIIKYILLKNPLDKAGSYGIQDFSDKNTFIKELKGSYYNVMGLDIELIKQMLDKI